MKHTYKYDRMGRIEMATKHQGEVTEFGHDVLNQLTSVSYQTGAADNGNNFEFSYDANGNRTKFKNDFNVYNMDYYKLNGEATNMLKNSFVMHPNYATSGAVGEGVTLSAINYQYDNRGNQILVQKGIFDAGSSAPDNVYETINRTFSLFNEMTKHEKTEKINGVDKTTTSNYEYDETGMRISKKVGNGKKREYIYEGPLVLCEREVGATKWDYHLYFGLNKVADIKGDGREEYYLTDNVGTVMKVLDGDGNQIHEYRYGPYGNLEFSKGISDNRYIFTGKEWDAESGLFYFGARYYDPSIGRWISKDPMDQFFSEYSYCGNDPLHMVDPWGLQDFGVAQQVDIEGWGWQTNSNGKNLYTFDATNIKGQIDLNNSGRISMVILNGENMIENDWFSLIGINNGDVIGKLHSGVNMLDFLTQVSSQMEIHTLTVAGHGWGLFDYPEGGPGMPGATAGSDGLYDNVSLVRMRKVINGQISLNDESGNFHMGQLVKGPYAETLKDLKTLIDSGSIRFANNAVIQFYACNISPKFLQKLADITRATVYASSGKATPYDEEGKVWRAQYGDYMQYTPGATHPKILKEIYKTK